MTLDEIEDAIALMRAAGRETIPVSLDDWREFMTAKLPKDAIRKTADGKTVVKMPDRASVSKKIGRKAKADRIEKGLRSNRARTVKGRTA